MHSNCHLRLMTGKLMPEENSIFMQNQVSTKAVNSLSFQKSAGRAVLNEFPISLELLFYNFISVNSFW